MRVPVYNTCPVYGVADLHDSTDTCISTCHHTAAAIALHNFPEGIATFIVGLARPQLGIALAVAIAVHNIPEGRVSCIISYCLRHSMSLHLLDCYP